MPVKRLLATRLGISTEASPCELPMQFRESSATPDCLAPARTQTLSSSLGPSRPVGRAVCGELSSRPQKRSTSAPLPIPLQANPFSSSGYFGGKGTFLVHRCARCCTSLEDCERKSLYLKTISLARHVQREKRVRRVRAGKVCIALLTRRRVPGPSKLGRYAPGS